MHFFYVICLVFQYGNYEYETISDSEVKVNGFVNEVANVIIPDTLINNNIQYTVRELDTSCFESKATITSIVIPASIKRIKNRAFYKSTSVSSLTFEKNSCLTYIGRSAFDFCSKLTSVELPETVEEIHEWTFSSTAVTNWKLPKSLKYIASGAFAYHLVQSFSVDPDNPIVSASDTCLYTENQKILVQTVDKADIDVLDTVEIIYDCAFSASVKNIHIPYMLRKLSIRAFERSKSLELVTYCGVNPFNEVSYMPSGFKGPIISASFVEYQKAFGFDLDTSSNNCPINARLSFRGQTDKRLKNSGPSILLMCTLLGIN